MSCLRTSVYTSTRTHNSTVWSDVRWTDEVHVRAHADRFDVNRRTRISGLLVYTLCAHVQGVVSAGSSPVTGQLFFAADSRTRV